MAIIGLPRWDNPDAYYSQTNNVVEAIIQKTGANRRLESCGPTSAIMLIDAIGCQDNLKIKTPGGWVPQPEDVLTAWFNDPRNYDTMRAVRSDIDPSTIMGNEVPQWYQCAVPAVFDVSCKFSFGLNKMLSCDAISDGRGVMVALKNPGHYVAIVAVDPEKNLVIYHDPWPNNPWPASLSGQPGAKRQISFDEFLANAKDFRIEIW